MSMPVTPLGQMHDAHAKAAVSLNAMKNNLLALARLMKWESAKCAGCDWPVLFIKLPSGKVVAYDDDLTPHFKTCPEAALFRKDRKRHGR